MTILSPLTGLPNTKIVDKIPVNTIIESYKDYLNIDVGDIFTGIGEILICECKDSGFRFYYPENIAGDEDFYDQIKAQLPLKQNTPYYAENRWEFNLSLRYINSSDKVYEIGAGDGAFLRKLMENNINDVFGSELNEDSIAHAKNTGVDIEYLTIEKKAKTHKNYYDVVCAFQVLEHIANVKPFIEAAIKILKPNGKLIFAVPYNHPYLFRGDKFNTLNMPPHHMGLWNKTSFEGVAKFFNLEIKDIVIEPLAYAGYDFEQYFLINKHKFLPFFPVRSWTDKLYYKLLKRYHIRFQGKNIFVVFTKNEKF